MDECGYTQVVFDNDPTAPGYQPFDQVMELTCHHKLLPPVIQRRRIHTYTGSYTFSVHTTACIRIVAYSTLQVGMEITDLIRKSSLPVVRIQGLALTLNWTIAHNSPRFRRTLSGRES